MCHGNWLINLELFLWGGAGIRIAQMQADDIVMQDAGLSGCKDVSVLVCVVIQVRSLLYLQGNHH